MDNNEFLDNIEQTDSSNALSFNTRKEINTAGTISMILGIIGFGMFCIFAILILLGTVRMGISARDIFSIIFFGGIIGIFMRAFWKLIMFGTKSRKAITHRDSDSLAESISNLKSYFKTLTIFLLCILGFALLLLLIALLMRR